MLELPESYTISKQIHESLSSKIISYIVYYIRPISLLFLAETWINTLTIWRGRRLSVQPIMAE